MMLPGPRYAWLRQLAAVAVVLAVWEAAGRADMLNPMYVPNPSRIGAALVDLFADGRISTQPSLPRSAVSRSALPLVLYWASLQRSFRPSRN
jgi:ABC-type nitrate/sulfonate/bicarbonate transport system permease component